MGRPEKHSANWLYERKDQNPQPVIGKTTSRELLVGYRAQVVRWTIHYTAIRPPPISGKKPTGSLMCELLEWQRKDTISYHD